MKTLLPIEPNTRMMRALLVWGGFDPDADESTLDHLGQLELATLSQFTLAYRIMVQAYLQDVDNPTF